MFKFIPVGIANDQYYIKLRLERFSQRPHIHVGGLYHTRTLPAVHSITRIHIIGRSGLHLHEADPVILPGDEIHLHPSDAYVHAVDGIALSEKLVTCHLLAPFAKLIMGRHVSNIIYWKSS